MNPSTSERLRAVVWLLAGVLLLGVLVVTGSQQGWQAEQQLCSEHGCTPAWLWYAILAVLGLVLTVWGIRRLIRGGVRRPATSGQGVQDPKRDG